MHTASQPLLISPHQCQSPWIPSCCPTLGQPQLPWDPLPTTPFLHSSNLRQAPFKWMGNAAAARLLQAIPPPLVPEAVQQKSPRYQVCKLSILYTTDVRAGWCLVKLTLASAVTCLRDSTKMGKSVCRLGETNLNMNSGQRVEGSSADLTKNS